MHLLETLGHIRLTDGAGKDVDGLLKQPKRLALLAYVASPAPGTWHRRDVLAEIFWPELDAQRARSSLRNALHVLRQQVGAATIRTRGDDDVSVDPALLATDAAIMERDAQDGMAARAFERYRGDYLRGLFIKEAESFERWLDDERRRLLAIARKTGLAAVNEHEKSGDTSAAIELIQRVVELDPHDESMVRRVIGLLDGAGDRARALAVYERFRARLAEDLNAEPSAETLALATAIRVRRPPQADGPSIAPQPIVTDTAITLDDSPQPARHATRWSRLFVAAAGIAAVAFAVLRGNAAPRAKRLLILPMENTAADSLDYLGSGINDEVARMLKGMGGLKTNVQSAAYDVWPRSMRQDVARVGRAFDANVVLRTTLSAAGDSLVLDAEMIDVDTKARWTAGRYEFVVPEARDVGSRLAANIAGKLFRAPFPYAPHAKMNGSESSESFRLAMRGWHQLLNQGDAVAAETLFLAATSLDASNARAWAGLSSVYSSAAVTWREEWAVAADNAEAAGQRALALDSLEGTAWANLGGLRGLKSHRVSSAESLFARAIALDPRNPELFLIEASLYRHAWQWDKTRDALRIAHELEPLSAAAVERQTVLELCADRPKEALVLARAAVALDPTLASAHRGAARAFARLGQWNDAVAELRLAYPSRQSNDAPDSASVAGEADYWALAERAGRAELTRLETRARKGWVAPVQLAVTHVAAGDLDDGLSRLEKEINSGDPGLYRLRCQPQVDRVRGTPRFNAILAALPKWTP
jgi:DNA-binding SARP family transcriptional activator/TolB-like protein